MGPYGKILQFSKTSKNDEDVDGTEQKCKFLNSREGQQNLAEIQNGNQIPCSSEIIVFFSSNAALRKSQSDLG
jgi:hypothetical protein